MKSTQEQHRAIDISKSIWVAASAGSGKTFVLANRVMALLLQGVKASEILCISYTETAANEMKNRISNRLCEWAYLPEPQLHEALTEVMDGPIGAEQMATARQLLTNIMDTVDGLSIMSFHAFCRSIIKRFPFESGVMPKFDIADEKMADSLLQRAKHCFFLTYAQLSQDTSYQSNKLPIKDHWDIIEVGQALRILTTSISDSLLDNLFGGIFTVRKQLHNFLQDDLGMLEYQQQLATIMQLQPQDFQRDFAAEMLNYQARDCCQQLLALAPGGNLRKRLEELLGYCQSDDKYVQSSNMQKYYDKISSIKLLNHWFPKNDVNRDLQQNLVMAEQQRIHSLHTTHCKTLVFSASVALLTVAGKILQFYEEIKHQRNLLDFDDLIIKANELFANADFCDWVLYKLDSRISHILIDEAQDTDIFQWSIVDRLAQEFFAGSGIKSRPATIFVVGDDKQSIYGFRGANPEIFSSKYYSYRTTYANTPENRDRLTKISLDVSFRSQQNILDLVDMVFAGAKERRAISRISEEPIKHISHIGAGGHVEIWPLLLQSSDDADNSKTADNKAQTIALQDMWSQDTPKAVQRLAELTAKQIYQWTNPANPRPLTGTDRTVTYGDILILLKDRTHLPLYINWLNRLGIPNSGADKITLNDSLIFQDVLSICQFILADYDDFNLACVLKSPMFALTEAELYALAAERQTQSLIAMVMSKRPDIYQRLRLYRFTYENSISLYAFFLQLFYPLGVKVCLQQHFGAITEAFIEQLLEIIYDYEQQHPHASLVGLMDFFATHQLSIKHTLDIGSSNQVTLTTIHSAKGLEAPIVILPDSYHDKTKIQHTYGENQALSWAQALPVWHGNRSYVNASLEGSNDTEAEYHEYLRQLYVALTRPQHELYIGGWSRAKTEVEADSSAQLSWYSLIKQRVRASNHPEWLRDSLPECDINIAPVATSTTISTVPEDNDTSWLQPRVREQFVRPSAVDGMAHVHDHQAVLRGKILHKLLELLPYFPMAKWDEVIQNYLQTQSDHIADKAQLQQILLRVLHKPEFQMFFGEGSQAEVPLIGELDGKVISGQIDRLVVQPDKIIVVDYKSSLSANFNPEQYRQQLKLYQRLLAKIYPNKPIQSYIIWLDRQEISEFI